MLCFLKHELCQGSEDVRAAKAAKRGSLRIVLPAYPSACAVLSMLSFKPVTPWLHVLQGRPGLCCPYWQYYREAITFSDISHNVYWSRIGHQFL